MILATRAGDVSVRAANVSGLAAILDRAGVARRTGGSVVTGRTLAALPAAAACVRVASWAVARTPIRVWRGRGTARMLVRATWQARFFDAGPGGRDPWFLVREMTEASLTARHNAYWLKLFDPAEGRIGRVLVLHPDAVDVKLDQQAGEPRYRFRVPAENGPGGWSRWLGPTVTDETPASVLHFRVGYPEPGCVVAPSPVQLYADSIGAAAERTRFEASLYERGVLQALAVEFPGNVTEEEANAWREVFQAEHGGAGNAGKVKVFGGGAKVSTIGLSLADAQFVESMALSAEEMARILAVQPSLIGIQRSDRPLSPEHEEDRWRRHGLEPRLTRIEDTLYADPEFFGAGFRDYPAFDPQPIRGDVKTESEALVREVQAGILLVDEARARRGLDPLPNGLGQIPQITPVGGAPNPAPLPAAGEPEPEED